LIFEIGDKYSLIDKTPNAASSVRITGDISNTKAKDSPKMSSQDKLKARHKVIKKNLRRLVRQRAVINFRMYDNISKDSDIRQYLEVLKSRGKLKF
jgi:hypothetical protein